MPLSTRRSFTRGTPRGLFGRNGLMVAIDNRRVVTHDSRLRFRSLNHAPSGGIVNPPRSATAGANRLIVAPNLADRISAMWWRGYPMEFL
jgi:hypothetical protein